MKRLLVLVLGVTLAGCSSGMSESDVALMDLQEQTITDQAERIDALEAEVAALVAVEAAVPERIDFEAAVAATFEVDVSEQILDTSPDAIIYRDGSLTIRLNPVELLWGLKPIEGLLEELGFSPGTWDRVLATRGVDGTVEAETNQLQAYWTYSESAGMTIIFEEL